MQVPRAALYVLLFGAASTVASSLTSPSAKGFTTRPSPRYSNTLGFHNRTASTTTEKEKGRRGVETAVPVPVVEERGVALNNSAHKRDDDPNYFGYDGTKYFPDFVTGYRTICGGAKNCEGGKDEDIACLVDCGLRRCKAQLGYDGKDWTDQNTNWCKWLYWHNYPRRDESVQTCGPFSLGPCPLENPILQRDDKDKDKPKDEDGFPIDDDDFIKDPKEEYNALCGLFGIGKCRLDTFVDPVCVKDCAKDLCVDWKLEIYNPGYPSHLDERKCRWLDYHDWPMESISDQAHENSKQKRDDKDEDKDDDTPMYVDAEEVCSEICGYIPGECDVGLDRDIGCLARCASKRCEDRRGYYGEDWNDEDEKKCKWLRHQPLWSPPGHE